MKQLLSRIKSEGRNLAEKTEEELKIRIQKIKKQIQTNEKDLNIVLPEWFALTQEISLRQIGLKHFETQLLAGYYLHSGKIIEMKTGEGKTLASTLSVSLNALIGKGVHVVTVNDYLAERDQKWMGKIYTGLGLTSGLIKSNSTRSEKKISYQADITYLTNSELVFDFLRDSSSSYSNEIVQRPFFYCVIDEIDSILIDEARTPLILSTSQQKKNINKLYLSEVISNILEQEIDFQIDEKRKDINLTENGYKKVKEKLGKKSLYEADDPWILEILNALKAKYIFKLNKDYIVLNNKIYIIDEFTGRVMEDRRWSLGIHEAIEIKEKVSLGGATKTKSSITYQNFFTLYPKLAGMTGTAKTTEKEFKDIYNLDVIVIPTAKPLIRKDLPDLVYQTELNKWKAVLTKAKECFEVGQPILIGTSSVEKSEFLSDLFRLQNLPHSVLNAKPENITKESNIIAQAGKKFAITIATNMAGRGTDIILGGNPINEIKNIFKNFLIEKKSDVLNLNQELKTRILNDYSLNIEALLLDIENLPFSLERIPSSFKELYEELYKDVYVKWKEENQQVKKLGGLFVLGTERHETRRIDNQLRGRSGRQGDTGSSQFYVSLDDELIQIFGGNNIKNWMQYLITEKDLPLESEILTKSLENAQKKVENYNYDLRKNIFQYDEILNTQRKDFFLFRNELLSQKSLHDLLLRSSENIIEDKDQIEYYLNPIFEKNFKTYSTYNRKFMEKKGLKNDLYKEIWITIDLIISETNSYEKNFLKKNRIPTILSILDFYWTEHLERMNYIRETINWRSYGQQNPLIEYNIEAFDSFSLMFKQIRASMLYYLINKSINK